MGLNILIGILLARLLGKPDYGFYTFVISLATLICIPTDAGLPTLMVREVARHREAGRNHLLHGLLRFANSFVLSYGLIAILITAGVIWILSPFPNPDYQSAFLIGLLLIPLSSLGRTRAGTLRGLQFPVLGQLPEQLIRPISILSLLGLAMAVGQGISLPSAMTITVAATLAAFGVGCVFLWRAVTSEIRSSQPNYEIAGWLTSLVPLSLFVGLKSADAQITNVLLGTIGEMDDVAVFRIATQGSMLVSFCLVAANLVIAPHIASLYHSGKHDSLQRLVSTNSRWVFLAALPVAGMFFFLGAPLIRLTFGPEFVSAAIPLSILVIGQLFNVASGSVVLILNMSGHEFRSLSGILPAILVKVTLTILLYPWYGVLGAAIGACISDFVWNGILVWVTYRVTGIDTFVIPGLVSALGARSPQKRSEP